MVSRNAGVTIGRMQPSNEPTRTLAEYLDWITRETGWRVEYAEPAIARDASTIVLHGSITGLRPDQTPLAVLPTCGLRHRMTDGTLTIERQAGEAGPS